MGVPRFGDCHMYYYTGTIDGLQAEKGDFFENFYFLFAGWVLPVTYLGVVRYKHLDLWMVTLKAVE